MPGKTTRSSNLELLRILCMLLIIGDHLTGQSGIADYTTLPSSFAFCLIGCGSRIACSVFVLIGGWFLCEQPYKTRRPLSLWLSLWLYTVPVTLLCKLAGLDVSWGALRWAAFPASTRQLWFISDYLLLLLCVPLLNRLLRGLSRPAHRGLLAVLAVPLIVYPTLFGENGAVSDTAWMFLYEYLLIAYLRRWPDNRLAHLLQHRAAALGIDLAEVAYPVAALARGFLVADGQREQGFQLADAQVFPERSGVGREPDQRGDRALVGQRRFVQRIEQGFAFVVVEVRQIQDGFTDIVAEAVVLVLQVVDRVDLGHAGHDHSAGVDAEVRVVGDVDVVAFLLDHLDQPFVVFRRRRTEVPVAEVVVGRVAEEVPADDAA